MIKVADKEIASLAEAGSWHRWLSELPGDSVERLSAIGRLLVRIGRPDLAVDASVALLEQARGVLLETVDDCLASIADRPLPYGVDAWRRLTDSTTTLRALRTMYKRAGTRIGRELQARLAGSDAGPADAAGSTTLPAPMMQDGAGLDSGGAAARSALPLLRALDVQARVVALLLSHRVEPLAEDWDELCLLARHARANGLLDVRIADPVPLVKPANARALFVYPLLLRLAGLSARTRAEAALIERFASRLAGQVGFRIDAGESKRNPLGPTLPLSAAWSVRLDSHRVAAALAKRREQWAETDARGSGGDGGSNAGPALPALLDDLAQRWAPNDPDLAGLRAPAPRTPAARHLLLQFGLPRVSGNGGAARQGLAGSSSSKAPAAPPGHEPGDLQTGGYVYGRWEQNTIIRMSRLGSAAAQVPTTPGDPMAGAETAAWVSEAAGRIVVERKSALPPAQPGSLVALRTEVAPQAAGRFVSRLAIIESVVQLAAPGYAGIRAHRVSLRLLPGQARAVGLKFGAARFFDEAWLLAEAGDGADPSAASLVLAPGLARAGSGARLRDGGHESAIRFRGALDSGPGFDRVGFLVDAADAAAATDSARTHGPGVAKGAEGL